MRDIKIKFSAKSLLAVVATLLSVTFSTANAQPIYKGKTWRIMSVGDSITEGKYGQMPDGNYNGGYRGYLQTLLSNNGYSFQFVGKEDNGYPPNTTGFANGMPPWQYRNHEGYGSYRIDQIANGVSVNPPEGHAALPIEQTIWNNNPDVVLMMLGTNDSLQLYYSPDGVGFNGQPGWAAQAAQRMNVLVERVFAAKPSIKLVLAKIVPIYNFNGSYWWYNTWAVQPYNSFIPQIVAKFQSLGYDITMVDQWSGITAATDLFDFTHPNTNGFQKIAQVWYNGLTGNTPIVSGGTYNLVNPNSGNKVLEVKGWGVANGSTVGTWSYTGGANQMWRITRNGDGTYTLINANSGTALEDPNWCATSPCSIDIWNNFGSDNQKWFISANNDGTYTLINKFSRLALDINGGSNQNGAMVQQYTENRGVAQRWILRQMN